MTATAGQLQGRKIMSSNLAQLARGGTPLFGGIAALVGGIAGGAGFLSASGVVMGLFAGLGVLGLAAIVASLMSGKVATETAPEAAGAIDVAAVAAAVTSGKAPGEGKVEATETEAKLLADGRFPEYHLAKAKRFLEAKNYKEAAYQAGASLSHGDLAEAAEIRKAAVAAMN
jgi:hypothetical protein